MSTRLPIEVNPYRLVEQRRLLSGNVLLNKMSRIQELTTSDNGEVFVELEFTVTDTGLPTIIGKVSGSIPLLCQRCMDSFEFAVNSDLQVILLKTDAEAERLQDSYDTWLVEDDRIFLQDFIEDELLLVLPVVAKHETCDLNEAALDASFDEEDKDIVQKEASENPFALLKDWKNTE